MGEGLCRVAGWCDLSSGRAWWYLEKLEWKEGGLQLKLLVVRDGMDGVVSVEIREQEIHVDNNLLAARIQTALATHFGE